MYKVIRPFCDSYDGNHTYKVGDKFPRPGKSVSDERINCLLTENNRCGQIFITEDAEEDLSEAKKKAEDTKTGSSLSKQTKAKGRPRKGQKKDARTDS